MGRASPGMTTGDLDVDVSKPSLPTTVTSVRASNRSGSSTQDAGDGVLPRPVQGRGEQRDDRRSAGDRRQGKRRRADVDVILDTRDGADRRKGPRRQSDRDPPDDDGPSLGIDVFV